MSKEPNNIDRLVREKLDGFEMTPPPSVWENTSASLNPGNKRRFLLWLVLGIVAFGILGTGVYYLSSEDSSGEQFAVNASEKTINLNKENNQTKNKLIKAKTSSVENNQLGSNTELNKNDENATMDSYDEGSDTYVSDKDDASTDKSNSQSKNLNGSVYSEQVASTHRSQKDNSSKQTQTDDGSSNSQTSVKKNLDSSGGDLAHSKISTQNNGERFPNGNSQGDKIDNQQNNLPNSIESNPTENYGSLKTQPIQQIKSEEPMLATNVVEEDSLPVPVSFWKSLSVEGAIGMSTFKNQAKESTPQSLIDALNSAASSQSSFDFRFGLNYHFTDRFSIQSGIHYNAAKEKYSFNNSEIVSYTQIDTISFIVDTMAQDTTYIISTVSYDSSIVTANEVQNSYRIFTLPFQFAWSQPISARGALEFSLGGAISIFGRNTGSVIVDNSNFAVGAETGYHTTGMLSLGGSIKYLHRFGNHHSVYVEPWAQFGVTNQSTPQISYESLRRRYGVRMGYRFYF
ncbi:MAG: hypothetical protein MK076_10630 [Flavobacteriales bacterium]|nr:hypothetical protein [Flavobacteriales bacterium]